VRRSSKEMASPEKEKKTTTGVVAARMGRLRQRCDNEYRLVAGCVPYRVGADGQPEVLMVSKPSHDDLVFPKVCSLAKLQYDSAPIGQLIIH
jgi:diphosphoinositol-polyphosphate diphosphatase